MYTIVILDLEGWTYRTYFCIYTVSTKNKARQFFVLFYLRLINFYRLWTTYS